MKHCQIPSCLCVMDLSLSQKMGVLYRLRYHEILRFRYQDDILIKTLKILIITFPELWRPFQMTP